MTEETVGGQAFVRVDVPETIVNEQKLPGFTKLFGGHAVYCITPCTEETARAFVQELRSTAFNVYEAPRLPAPAAKSASEEDDDPDAEFDAFLEGQEIARDEAF